MSDSSTSFNNSQSTNTSDSTSTSLPSVTETPENAIIDQISGVASGLANKMLDWANGVFSKTSQITDQAVGNFFNVSQQMQGLSNNLTDQYNNVFAPQNRSLAREADSYNSTARQQLDMGQAGATQAQAGDQAMKNSEEALRSYGIDPSSGRYAALDKAAAVQNAANVAGAENMQRNADAATGQRLRSEAVQVGATLPAAIANVNNTAIQANTGASNATLANANTGRNLMGLPNDYLKTAIDVKLPPSGQRTNSQSQGRGQSTGNGGSSGSRSDPNSGNRSGGADGHPGGGAGSGSGGGGAWMPQHGGAPGGGSFGGGDYSYDDPMSGVRAEDFTGGEGSMGIGDAGGNDNIWNNDAGTGFGDPNPFNDGGFGQTYGDGGDTYTGGGGGSDAWGGQYGSGNTDAGNQSSSGWDNTYDQPQANTDWGSGASAYGSDYRLGGAIPQKGTNRHAYAGPRPNFMADGGAIDTSMSPSGGQQTDDVQAQGPGGQQLHMNANEFVIPQDVALWKGQEFFQKLIEQSRKMRPQAPAHGTPTQPQR